MAMHPRRMTASTLSVWMNGEAVGYWSPKKELFQYHPDWSTNPHARALSLSMPLTPGNAAHKGEVVSNYFDNLLPDSDAIRRRLATKFQTRNTSAGALLEAVGRDCVGAIQLLPHDAAPPAFDGIQGVPLTTEDVADILRNTTTSTALNLQSVPSKDGLRLSIAGAQEKNALLYIDDRWFLPVGTTPTTHILKLPLGLVGNMKADMSTSVENEWLCSRIVHAFGIPIAFCKPAIFGTGQGAIKALVVERFDRAIDDEAGILLRLPQEDMCQALGVNSLAKYEMDGGPTAKNIIDLLRNGMSSEQDCLNFFKSLLVFWLLAATDGHAKNFSIKLHKGGSYSLAPLYDVLSAHPLVGKGQNHIPKQKLKLAMAVVSNSKHYLVDKIVARHWVAFGQYLGFPEHQVKTLIHQVYCEVPAVIEQAKNDISSQLNGNFPNGLAQAIFNGMLALRERLAIDA